MTPTTTSRKGAVPLVLFGIPFHNLTFTSTLEWIDELVATEQSKLVATANLDFHRVAAEDPEMQRILFDADIMMADGHPIVKLSPFFGPRLKERVTGSDMTPMLAEHAAKKGHRLFFLGAAPGVAQKAADILTERHPGLKVVGCYSPEKADVINMKSDVILQKLEETKPDIMLVAFGAPKQEKWIQMHRNEWNVPVSMGIGGSLDFIAGAQMRAPVWMQKLGLEWLGRLLANPKRLLGRYMQDGLFLLGAIGRLTVIRIVPSGPVIEPLDQTSESNRLSDLDAVYVSMKPLKTLEDGEQEAARLMNIANGKNLVLRPESATWLNSVELGVLVYLARECRQLHRCLVVQVPAKRISKLLYAQGLNHCFPIVESSNEVIRNLERHQRETILGKVVREHENKLVIFLPGELTAENKNEFTSKVLHNWCDEEKGLPSEILIDASPMRYIDYAGLSILFSLKEKAEQAGIPLSISGLQNVPERIIKVNQLDRILEW